MQRGKNWKARDFLWKNENLKQEIGIQITFILEIKHEDFSAKHHRFFN